jgi:hypothetical protein
MGVSRSDVMNAAPNPAAAKVNMKLLLKCRYERMCLKIGVLKSSIRLQKSCSSDSMCRGRHCRNTIRAVVFVLFGLSTRCQESSEDNRTASSYFGWLKVTECPLTQFQAKAWNDEGAEFGRSEQECNLHQDRCETSQFNSEVRLLSIRKVMEF